MALSVFTSRHMMPRPNKCALTKVEHTPTVISSACFIHHGGKPAKTQRHGAGGPMLGICSHHIAMQGNTFFSNENNQEDTEAWGWWTHAWNTFSPHSHAGIVFSETHKMVFFQMKIIKKTPRQINLS